VLFIACAKAAVAAFDRLVCPVCRVRRGAPAIISLYGSLRPRSTSERYRGEIPARSAVCARVSSRSMAGPGSLPDFRKARLALRK
jgi:hypothetical protein